MSSYIHDIDRTKVPDHVAIVMDGNGRWATQRGLPRTEGHGAGEEALWDTVKGAVEVGVKWLTVYAFSTENWSRPPGEVRYLMNFNRGLLQRRRDELHTMNVRIRFIGRRDWRVPRSVLREIDIAEQLTRDNTGMTFTIAFNYGGRKEVVDAVKQLAREVQAGTLKPSKIDDRAIAERLYAADAPDPDLLIRTSGEMRTSNFLLWEVAYSELWFTPVFWPDFNREHLFDVFLPGVVCQAVLNSPLSMECHEADDPWPLGVGSSGVRGFYSPARNFFTGAVAPGIGKQNTFPAFYTAAGLPRQQYVLWALAAVDGSVHLVDGVNDVMPKVPWGSDIAAVKSDCGSGWQILASSKNGSGDSVRAYEIMDREPAAVGTVAEFSGALTALWSKDDGSAVGVERNPDTGKYEAYSLAVACHQ